MLCCLTGRCRGGQRRPGRHAVTGCAIIAIYSKFTGWASKNDGNPKKSCGVPLSAASVSVRHSRLDEPGFETLGEGLRRRQPSLGPSPGSCEIATVLYQRSESFWNCPWQAERSEFAGPRQRLDLLRDPAPFAPGSFPQKGALTGISRLCGLTWLGTT